MPVAPSETPGEAARVGARMTTIRNKDTVATTHAVSYADGVEKEPPMIVAPPKGGDEWVLLSTASVCDRDGHIHFFWFWREVREGERDGSS